MELREYQKECIGAIFKRIEEGDKKIAVIAPVGSGKTVMFSAFSSEYTINNPDKMVLVLSHLSILTTQTENRLNEDFPNVKVGIMQADKFPTEPCDVMISTMQSSVKEHKITAAMTHQANIGDRNKVGVIIIDEMHLILTESYQTILSYFPDAIVIGFTATPWRSGYLITNYFDSVAYSISTQSLIDQKFLVPPRLFEIEIADDSSAEERMARVIDIYKRQEMGKKAIVFLKTMDDAKDMSRMFVDIGISSEPITCKITGEYRDDLLDNFRHEKLQVLTTVNVLTAGFDAPCVEVIFMPYATKSPTTYMQRIGRGLRPFENKAECRIYCLGDAPSIHKGLYSAVQNAGIDAGGRRKPNDIYDELQDYEALGNTDNEEYRWTQRMVDVADRVKSLKATEIHNLIRLKEFPKRFMRNIDMFVKNIPTGEIYCAKPYEPVTVAQAQALKYLGFTEDQVSKMKRIDASFMIETQKKISADPSINRYMIKSGRYMGRHVRDLPIFYKNYVLSMLPNSGVAQTIRAYYTQGGKHGVS